MATVAINSTNFPDDAFRNFVKNTIAGGSNTLTAAMLANGRFNANDLGIKNITGIELLGTLAKTLDITQRPLISFSSNRIPYFDLSSLNDYSGYLLVSLGLQEVIFNAKEIQDSGDTNYPYQININKYIPPSKILAVRVWGTKTSQSATSTDYVIKGNMLKIKQRARQIEYQFSSEGWGLGEIVDMYSDPYMRLPNSEAKQTIQRKKSFSLQINLNPKTSTSIKDEATTLPVTWSVSEGELPPGLSLNSSTGLISGTPI